MHYGSGSVVPSRSAGFTNTGSPRPARPGQLDQMMADNIAGGDSEGNVVQYAVVFNVERDMVKTQDLQKGFLLVKSCFYL